MSETDKAERLAAELIISALKKNLQLGNLNAFLGELVRLNDSPDLQHPKLLPAPKRGPCPNCGGYPDDGGHCSCGHDHWE